MVPICVRMEEKEDHDCVAAGEEGDGLPAAVCQRGEVVICLFPMKSKPKIPRGGRLLSDFSRI